ncbi:HAMP domain-containing histidine kinase [Halobacillus salinarum]|uniref:histidine kinase n=1 Tax=Halobacillus salinarum TaxID=2932257 RepID=A0ABY4EJS2_9BACI|nr:HAMP domain-containing sensor histidine kinase [Halobacillus salinarum]UOQ44725.1 HAMP domain-containing histidine kinase [Halobacillus salinarum]
MVKLMRSFRSRMILLVAMSMIFSAMITYAVYKALQWYYRATVSYADPLMYVRRWMYRIGDINFFLLLFIPLAIVFFYFLTKPYSTYFKEISTGIRQLAEGNFKHRINVDSNDEFKEIARDINMAGEKLEEAIERGDFSESSKDQLIINLAHDLRTPLTSVLGYLDLILYEKNLTPEQMNHYLNISYAKSQRLERLIDKLFETTRMNYGMLELHKGVINVSDLLLQINEEMFPMFEKNHLTTRLDVEQDLYISGDGELLARVFENLLTNANRYGYDGYFIDVKGFNEGKEVVVCIINYGDPIPEEDLPYVFEVFYKGDHARTHQENSTGLGLFIAKNIVEQHHGTLSVESDVIQTVFKVRLPKGDINTEEVPKKNS